ncbi:hypothetical protein MANES_16G046469v8 [Manihot esculenta]|uniref:Uncharacterized protein n=1 Tax=Manihot esculenta TaxID=3983 RepID=A0ACB7G6S4_MANES|nr:hypothetical protein MANES_16G046469v8 [Manihot esculenta]
MVETNPIVLTLRNNQIPPIIINQDSSAFRTKVKKPPPEDPRYAIWVTENYKIKSWLIDSMDPLLMQWFIHLSTAKKIWEVVAKTFYDESDETCLFELNQKSFSTTQNGRPLSTYYNKLVAIFQEIDHRMNSQEETVEGVVQLHSAMARLQVHIFLNGLDLKFDHIRGEILWKDPKLNLESTYAYVRREYKQRQMIGGSRPIPKSSTMVAKRIRQGPSSGSTKTQSAKSNNLVCSYYGETGHSKQRFYENHRLS